MPNRADKKAAELSPEARSELEKLLGRRLDHDERVSIRAYRTRPAPAGQERARACERLDRAMYDIAQEAQKVPQAELQGLLDEVCDEVRHGSR